MNSRFNVKFQSTDRVRAIRYLGQYCQFVKCSNAAKETNSMTPAEIENSTNFIILIRSFNDVLPFRFRRSGSAAVQSFEMLCIALIQLAEHLIIHIIGRFILNDRMVNRFDGYQLACFFR